MKMRINSDEEMRHLGHRLGALAHGGTMIELIGDVGAGKTTFTKGLALGLGVREPVQSPTFTISRIYAARDDLELHHYDFYRLGEAGIMSDELTEAITAPANIVVVEWGDVVDGVLPADRLQVAIQAVSETGRDVTLSALGSTAQHLLRGLA